MSESTEEPAGEVNDESSENEALEGELAGSDANASSEPASGSEGDVLFRQLLEVLLAKMDEGIDDLLAVQEAVQRFGGMATLLTMHMLMDVIRETPQGNTQSIESLALKWIEDNARSYAEGLMNQDVLKATAQVVGAPELNLHFGRAFRRRLLGFN